MNKNRTILILGILTLVTPFLGIPNGVQDWLIAIYGLILIFIILFEYFSSREHLSENDSIENVAYPQSTFEENGVEEESENGSESEESASEEIKEEEESEGDLGEESNQIEESEDDRIR